MREVGEGQEHIDYTLWTGAADLANHRYYFRTFANSRIRMVDLSRVKRDAPEVLTISMAGDEEITDVSDQAK